MVAALSAVLSIAPLRADESAALRQQLPTLKGAERLSALEQLYNLSQDSDDVDYQLRCLNEFHDEACRLDCLNEEASALASKALLFYNNDMNDSVLTIVPGYMKRLKQLKEFRVYYEMWSYIAETYIFSGQNSRALDETKAMYEDAKQQENPLGMGQAYCLMGMAYSNLRNFDESVEAFKKGISILMAEPKLTPFLPDAFSYYGDVLNSMKAYEELEQLTVEWESVLKHFIEQHGIEGTPSADVCWSYYFMACAQASLGQGKLDEAALKLQRMRELITSEDSYRGRAWLYYMSELMLRKGDLQQALDYSTRRLAVQTDDGDKAVIVMINQQRAEIMQQLGHYKEAAQLFRFVYQLNDSLNAQETKKQLNEMSTQFGLAELEKAQARLKMQQQEEQMRWMMAVAAIVVVSLAVFLFFRIRSARKQIGRAHV